LGAVATKTWDTGWFVGRMTFYPQLKWYFNEVNDPSVFFIG